jgi:hypothetical protein
MARFGESFLQQLGRPGWAQGMFGLGEAIGGVQGQLQQKRKEQEQLKRYDQIAQMSEQGYASAQSGDVANVTSTIDQLQQTRENAKTLEEKEAIERRIIQLQGLLPGAEKVSIGNNARELVGIEEKLKDSTLDRPTRSALETRREKLMGDPRAVQEYQKYKMSQWNFEASQTEMKSKEWLTTNSKSIDQAIQTNDMEALETIVQGAGEFSPAAQTYINASLRNAESMAKFEENSIAKTTAPNVDFYTEQVNNLPDEIKKALQPILNAYSEAAESGWNEKNKTWSSGQLARAKVLERRLQGDIRAFNQQVASAEYASRVSQDRERDKRVREIDLWLETPMGVDYRKDAINEAKNRTERGEVPTEEMINEIEIELYEKAKRQKIAERAALLTDPDEPQEEIPVAEEVSITINGKVTTNYEVQERAKLYGVERTKNALRKTGATEEQISKLFGEAEVKQKTAEELVTGDDSSRITPEFLAMVKKQQQK